MKCKLCLKEVIVRCKCGYCNSCIARYGHDNCGKVIDEINKIVKKYEKKHLEENEKKT